MVQPGGSGGLGDSAGLWDVGSHSIPGATPALHEAQMAPFRHLTSLFNLT